MPEFYMKFARKINKVPEFYMIFARKINKIPEFYTIFSRKIFFPILGGGATAPPLAPRLLRLWLYLKTLASQSHHQQSVSGASIPHGHITH